MYVTVRRSKHFGGTDEIVRRAKESLLPTLTIQPGFVSYHIFSLEDNVVMGITIFDSQAAEDLRSLITGPHEVLSGEVLVHVIEPGAAFPEPGGYGA